MIENPAAWLVNEVSDLLDAGGHDLAGNVTTVTDARGTVLVTTYTVTRISGVNPEY